VIITFGHGSAHRCTFDHTRSPAACGDRATRITVTWPGSRASRPTIGPGKRIDESIPARVMVPHTDHRAPMTEPAHCRSILILVRYSRHVCGLGRTPCARWLRLPDAPLSRRIKRTRTASPDRNDSRRGREAPHMLPNFTVRSESSGRAYLADPLERGQTRSVSAIELIRLTFKHICVS
jgi:hypothetical protein